MIAALWLAAGAFLFAAEESREKFSTNLPLQEISSNVFQLGKVVLNKKERSVQFPAQINLGEGLIEYLLVTTKGKTHESLLKTEVEPQQIHVAMLLLGAKGAPQTPELLRAASSHYLTNKPSQPNPLIANLSRGDPISIELNWRNEVGEKKVRAENCILNLQTKTNASAGPWSYNGSRVVDGVFFAQREGSIVAMVDDVDAMANNPRAGHDNDQVWQINTNAVPPVNTPVQVMFRLETKTNK